MSFLMFCFFRASRAYPPVSDDDGDDDDDDDGDDYGIDMVGGETKERKTGGRGMGDGGWGMGDGGWDETDLR